MPTNKTLNFPKNFLWGTSTSAYQIEGGTKNDWSEWENSGKRIEELKKKGLNPDDFVCGRGCDSYNRYEEDFELAKSLSTNAIRFGIEWARVEGEKGKFSEKEIEHYRDVIRTAKEKEFKIVLTLWHWTNPLWLTHEGGWTNKKAVEHYSRYVKKIVDEFGDQVDYWVTLNEPMVHISNGYMTGKFPPNKKCFFKARKVFNNLVQAHKEAYRLIHEANKNAQVSITQLTNYFEPARRWFFDEWFLSKIFNHFWNLRFLDKIKSHLDYIGVDYYFHDRVVWYPPFKKNLNKITTDLGWEIFPEGIYQVLKLLNRYKKPIIVLENGLADKEDKYRADFIREHIYNVYRAIEDGVDVKGYFHWSLLDNFEWAEGWTPRFGLFEVDKNTFERKMRPSAKLYAEICKSNKLNI